MSPQFHVKGSPAFLVKLGNLSRGSTEFSIRPDWRTLNRTHPLIMQLFTFPSRTSQHVLVKIGLDALSGVQCDVAFAFPACHTAIYVTVSRIVPPPLFDDRGAGGNYNC